MKRITEETMEPQPSNELIKQAIALRKADDMASAIPLLVQALSMTPNNEAAWLWLAACLTEPSERRYCIAQALIANPESIQARTALVRFEGVAAVRPAVLGAEPIELPLEIGPLAPVTPTQPLTLLKPKRSPWPIIFLSAVIGLVLIGGGGVLLVSNIRAGLGIALGGNLQATVEANVKATQQANEIAVAVKATQEAQAECGSASLTAYADTIEEEIRTFEAQITVVDSTPRMSIGVPLQKLLDVQTETRRIHAPSCLKSYHERLVGMMDYYRIGFQTFAAQGDETLVEASIQLGMKELAAVKAGLTDIRSGQVPATPTPPATLTPKPTATPAPTSKPTFTPGPTATATTVPIPTPIASVSVQGDVEVRSGPGDAFDVLTTLHGPLSVIVTASNFSPGNPRWYHIQDTVQGQSIDGWAKIQVDDATNARIPNDPRVYYPSKQVHK